MSLTDGKAQFLEEVFPAELEERHVRNSQNYLAPGGLINKVRIPAILIRGIMINFLIFLPWIMLAVLLTDQLQELVQSFHWRLETLYLAPPALFLALVLTFPVIANYCHYKLDWAKRNYYELGLGLGLFICLISVLIAPLQVLTREAINISWDDFLAIVAGENPLDYGRSVIWWAAVPLAGTATLKTVVKLTLAKGIRTGNRNSQACKCQTDRMIIGS